MAWDDDEIDYSCFEDDDYKKGDNYYDDDDWGRAAARYEDIKHIEATQRRGWLTNY